jgi:hypothetical protein
VGRTTDGPGRSSRPSRAPGKVSTPETAESATLTGLRRRVRRFESCRGHACRHPPPPARTALLTICFVAQDGADVVRSSPARSGLGGCPCPTSAQVHWAGGRVLTPSCASVTDGSRAARAACLATDPDPHVRAMSAELVGKFARSEANAVAALRTSHVNDPSPAVRKKAGWFIPGGPHLRTDPADRDLET